MRNRWAPAWGESSIGRLAGKYPRLGLFCGALLLAAFSTAWLLIQNPDFFSGYDFVRMHVFYKAYFREAVLGGRLPLWNPMVGLGRPFMADIETETLYPPNLLVLPLGVFGGIAGSLLLHLAIAIYSGVRLGRKLGAASAPSLLLGVGIALASPFAARVATGMMPVYFTLCWWPALLWLGACLQDQWSRGNAARLAAVVALAVLAGNPPILFVEMFGLFVFLLFRLGWPKDASALRLMLGNHLGLAFAGLLGFGIASAQLLPFAELISQGNRPLHSAGFAVANGMPPASWLSLIFPTSVALGPNWEYDLYCGLVPLFAALGALFMGRDRNVRALLGLGLAGALLSVGDRAPFLGWVVHLVPGASALRLPSRYGIWFATALLGLASIALSRRAPRPLPMILGGFGVAAAWIVWLRPYVGGSAGHVVLYYAIHLGALGIAALLVAAWHLRARWPQLAGAIGCMLGIFCAVDWAWAIWLQAPVYSQYGFRTDEKAAHAYLDGRGLLAAGTPPPRISFNPEDLCEDSGMTVGFSTFNSYSNPALSRVWNYLHVAAGVPESGADFIRLPQAIDADPGRLDALNLVAQLGHRTGAFADLADPRDPRAYLTYDAEVTADWRAAEVTMAARRDFHRKALLEVGTAPPYAPVARPPASSAEVFRFLPENVVVHTSSEAPAILVLAEAWYPGWRATIEGRGTVVFPVNGWMRGVVVPAGDHEVAFSYHSRLLPAGLGITAASLILLAGLALSARGSDRLEDLVEPLDHA
jgi:hypothetical protein